MPASYSDFQRGFGHLLVSGPLGGIGGNRWEAV
jgi:hypothetical protein